MRSSKLRKLELKRSIESMNMMPESCKDLILVYEQKTGTPWRGVGILTHTAPETKKREGRDRPNRDTVPAV
jgi:hypothetical protein